MFGWSGKILYVDLSNERMRTEALSERIGADFLGARGINARILWDSMKPGVDSFDPENVLIFGTGPLTGHGGKTTVTCKGAETNLYLKSVMGGYWGAELKFAGYDHVVIQGASEKPRYLWIDDANSELRDATHLWGLDVRETDKTLKQELDDEEVKVACIGPAGENLVRFASVMCSVYQGAARGGAGAVMGSKKLKAIAVRGSGEIKVKHPERFSKVLLSNRLALADDPGATSLSRYGTAGGIASTNADGRLPCHNFQFGQFQDIYPLSGQCLVERGYLKRRIGCFGCHISCHRYCTVDSGPYKGASTGGPEFETVSALGADCGVIDTAAVIRANELCNVMGLDTISTGSTIAWALETYQRGLIKKEDADGMELRFGMPGVVIDLIRKIARRDGHLANILAEGTKRAAMKIGKGSEKWAMCNSKGLEQSMVDTRCRKAYALAFAVNPRGPDHLHGQPWADKGSTPDSIALIEKLTGDRKLASAFITTARPEIVIWHEDCYAVTDSLGLCTFGSVGPSHKISPKIMAEMFSAATGIEVGEEELLKTGRRIMTLERCYNVREGADRKLDDLPWRNMHEPVALGPRKGMITSQEELDGMLDKYYSLHEWDVATGVPRKETLKSLGLQDVEEELTQRRMLEDN